MISAPRTHIRLEPEIIGFFTYFSYQTIQSAELKNDHDLGHLPRIFSQTGNYQFFWLFKAFLDQKCPFINFNMNIF